VKFFTSRAGPMFSSFASSTKNPMLNSTHVMKCEALQVTQRS